MTRRPFRATPASVVSLAFLALAVAGCQSRIDAPAAPAPSASPAGAGLDPAVGGVGTPLSRFVGSEACRPCHETIWNGWNASRHHTTLRAVGDSTVPRIAGLPPRDGYGVTIDGVVRGPGADGKPLRGRAAYVVGGRHREDLWVRLDDGRLQVFPMSWDTDADDAFFPLRALAGGDAPPADGLHFWTRLGRSADLVCYGCHATGAVVTVAGATPGGNAVPRSRWVEAGVGCEACHGPAGAHVEAARDGGKPTAATLRSLRNVDAETAVGTCAACHGLRELLSSPFRPNPAQGYGDPLWKQADPVLRTSANFEFREAFFPDLRPATYQQEAVALGQSGCVRRGGLTCAACHDVHSGAPTASVTGPSEGDETCRPCHRAIVENAAGHSRHPAGSAGARCLACHMAPFLRGPGKSPARDHSLAPPRAAPAEIPAACASCHAGAEWSARLPAAWRAFPGDSAPSRRRRATAHAMEGAAAGARGAAARLAALLRDPAAGWFERWAAATRASELPAASRDAGAAGALRSATDDPNLAVRRAAINSLGRIGTAADARAVEKSTEDADPFVALDAAVALGRLGDPLFFSRLTRVTQRPDLTGEFRAQLVLGQTALMGSDWVSAEQALRRAIELNPAALHAWNDLGAALLGQQRVEEARKIWTQILETLPAHKPALQNLEDSKSLMGASPR